MKIYVDDTVYTVNVASAAADTTVTTSGTGTSLIKTSVGGQHTLKSISAGANVTLTDDGSGTLTISSSDTEDNLSNNTTSDLAEGTNKYFTDARVDTRINNQLGSNLDLSGKYTDQLAEGGTNKYFTDARVMTSLETVSGDIVPDGDKTRSLGSATKQWKDVYVGPGTLYIDGHPILSSDASGTINITTDTGQTLDILAGGGSGTAGTVNIASRSNTTSLNDTTVNLGPSTGGGSINARGTLEAPDFHNGALEFNGTLIEQTDNNQNLEIRTNGSGYLHLNAADVYVGPVNGAVKIDEGSITTTAGNLTISATGTVDVAGHNTTAETAALIATAKTEANTYADAAVAVLTSGASAAFDTLVEIKTLMDSGDATLNTAIGNLNHDTLSGFVANEHIDWTTDQGATNIHAGNYTDTNTIYTDAEAISAIEGETTLDLSGTITIDELTFSQFSAGGENGNSITADENRVLMLNASGAAGYVYTVAPAFWLGDGSSGAFFQSNSSAASTLKPWGQNMHIGPYVTGGPTFNVTFEGDLTGDVTGDLTGDVTGDVTGDLNGDLTATKTNTKGIAANTQGLTIPGVSQWGGFSLLNGGDGIRAASTPATGYPFVGIHQTNNINQSQPQAAYFINQMEYDISGGLSGHGVQVSFAAQDETGKILDIANNLCKLREEIVSGSSGSSTVDSWNGEYTLSVTGNAGSGANNVTTNVITTNTDFTETTKELRVVNKPGNSGNTDLSGVYLTYSGAETGTPSALLQLRDSDDDENTENIKLEQDRTTFGAVTKQYKASSDPTGQNGDMYYNTTSHKFRGYANGSWVDLH